ncbi:MAG: hypothetical protein IKD72_09190 [Clostridia bacterium]|nr:hypothetical protein [Clostridia bacterium]
MLEWDGDGIQEDENYDILVTLISDTEAAKAGALAATIAANAAAESAGEEASAAESAAARAESAAASANLAADLANGAATAANIAEQDAYDAADEARAKAEIAENAATTATEAANAATSAKNTTIAATNAANAARDNANTAADEAYAAAGRTEAAINNAVTATQNANTAAASANAAATSANSAAANASTEAANAQSKATLADTAATNANTAAAAADTAREAIQGDLAAMDARIDTLEDTVPSVDATLTVSGDAADAKAAGDRIGALEVSDAETDKLKIGAVGIIPIPIATAGDLTDGGMIRYATGARNSSSVSSYSKYISVEGMSAIVYTRMQTATASAPTSGIAFYTGNHESDYANEYISGLVSSYGAPEPTVIMQRIAVPQGAKYARFTYYSSDAAAYARYPFAVYNAADYDDSVAIVDFETLFPHNLYMQSFASGYIKWADGVRNSSSSSVYTDYVDISECESITYTRITTPSASTYTGMAFYDENKSYISGDSARTNAAKYGYELQTIAVPSGAKYARFSWGGSFGAENFAVYNTSAYNTTMQAQIDRLNASRPDYTGLKASILGDSISTFVLASEKEQIDGRNYAPAGCVTNYPGNLVQYANSDVQTVDATWWSKVLAMTGMTLGINESFAGSMISWDGTTETYKYGADKCMASEARIGHLDDNGTPNVILIFGGTNDINHYKELGIPLGTLDTTHDPSDFANFPMVTNTIYGAITTMLLRVQHSYPTAQILCILPYYCTAIHNDVTPYDVDLFDTAYITVCNYLGVDYVDLRKVINLYDISRLTFDNLHPTAAGMLAIANEVVYKLYSAKQAGKGHQATGSGGNLPPSTRSDAGKVLKVNSTGGVEWGASGGAESSYTIPTGAEELDIANLGSEMKRVTFEIPQSALPSANVAMLQTKKITKITCDIDGTERDLVSDDLSDLYGSTFGWDVMNEFRFLAEQKPFMDNGYLAFATIIFTSASQIPSIWNDDWYNYDTSYIKLYWED